MPLTEFVEKFAGCFNQTAPASITAGTEFKKLGEWGSMLTLIVIAMIDADYEKTITAEDLKACATVGELFELINNK